jgi:phytoene synthase
MSQTEPALGLIETLPVLQRLALSYAPAASREAWLGLLALDARLAGVVRAASEPMLAQLRLAWWREQFRNPLTDAPAGEPLLAVLRTWEPERAALEALVDGWEAITADPPLPATAMMALARGRGRALGALASLTGARDDEAAERLGLEWALADIASRLGDPKERGMADALVAACEWRSARLPRTMRPLAVMHGIAARAVRRGEPIDAGSPVTLALAIRIGLLGW